MTKSVLLIISGSIAAIKTPDLIRRLRAEHIGVRVVMTVSAKHFVQVSEIEKASGQPVSDDLFAPEEMQDMGHIRFSREADLVVVAPASANIIAQMAHGLAPDMATATLLANNKKLLVAPAMNTYMWEHPATQRNVAQILADGATVIEPREGLLACGETGQGRMAEPEDIVAAVLRALVQTGEASRPSEPSVRLMEFSAGNSGGNELKNLHALVTAGPTREAIDPVRFISNRSSGKQGYAIAAALARHGANVTLVSGPTELAAPAGVKRVSVLTADEMLAACESALPADVAVCTAAVADWKMKDVHAGKRKKDEDAELTLHMVENPDILATLSQHKKRPALVIGFAAETSDLLKNAKSKLAKKHCDWVVANDVSGGKVFDKDDNQVTLVTPSGEESWPLLSKDQVAEKLVERIIFTLCNKNERVKAIS